MAGRQGVETATSQSPATVYVMTGFWCQMCCRPELCSYSHRGKYMCTAFRGDGREGVTQKDPVIVSDHAANMTRAVEMMELLHMGCFAHTINLASQAALKLPASLDGTAGHARQISGAAAAISAALLSPEVRRSEKDLCTLTEEDITVAEDIVKALQPMKSSTLVMSGENTATLSVNAPLHTQILDETRSSDRDSTVFKELRSAMHDNLKYENLKEKLHVASALDPRFKSVPFISEEERDDTFTSLISEMVTLEQVKAHDQECDSAGNGGSKTSPPQPRQTAPAPVAKAVTSAAADRAREEVGKYRDVTPVPLSEDPLKWWCKHEGVTLFCLSRQNVTFVFQGQVSQLKEFSPQLGTLLLLKEVAFCQSMLTNSFSCKKNDSFQ
ncbi:E3 SUMO-protein ligase ZBED1 [Labeo rohita]|uniref:E3 SUMO-protein ligase ZBED1 n=1 Tax=Labeo rohita TaxID=84645 RepID=A0ABQ8L6F0_LABRO|nr:E3 SUMO-protein ligase ZBED1 [Labeo rohita]